MTCKYLCQTNVNTFYSLDFLMNYLYRFSQKSSVHKMDTNNLGICFGPTLIGLLPENNSLISLLIENYPQIFPTESPPTPLTQSIGESNEIEDSQES